jgi:hypothetical protein
MEMEGSDVLIGHCLAGHDFAVLCRDCEEPDLANKIPMVRRRTVF